MWRDFLLEAQEVEGKASLDTFDTSMG